MDERSGTDQILVFRGVVGTTFTITLIMHAACGFLISERNRFPSARAGHVAAFAPSGITPPPSPRLDADHRPPTADRTAAASPVLPVGAANLTCEREHELIFRIHLDFRDTGLWARMVGRCAPCLFEQFHPA
jgi:hypothetical protein